jgi:hypothetical protein
MADSLRRLNAEGINRFAAYLGELRKDRTLAPDRSLLVDESTSEFMAGGVELEQPGFSTKKQAAEYLHPRLKTLDPPDLFRDAQLWTWLALYYFDDVCPADEDGKRKPVADPHYILDAQNHRRRYRHLLATPVLIKDAIPDHNRIYLNAPLPVHGELVEQTMSRLYLIRIPAVREAIDRLYFDTERDAVKPGAVTRTRRGNLRERLTTRIQQLSMTYDVSAMSSDQLIEALGTEFEQWAQS